VLVSLVALNTFLLDCKEVDKAGIFCVGYKCMSLTRLKHFVTRKNKDHITLLKLKLWQCSFKNIRVGNQAEIWFSYESLHRNGIPIYWVMQPLI
jgi:hypothetical protein